MSALPPSFGQRLALRERPRGFAIMRQRWAGLLFLHWPIDPGLIAERLPKGLHVDTFDGKAWLGVVPFFMARVRPSGLPPLPWLSWFMELNLRTYVYDDEGNAGVWFFSLDCNQPLAVEIARRCFNLPYEHAEMRSKIIGDRVEYHSRRKATGASMAEYIYDTPTVHQPAEPHTLEWFLVERYLLFSCNSAGRLFTGRVHHSPYEISVGRCTKLSTEPIRLSGFPVSGEPPHSVLTAADVDVSIFPLRKMQ